MLSGTGDLALWLELGAPRWLSAEDRLLITVLIGHLSLAMQHVRQFESARETSLTLQRAMLPPIESPPGFVMRYEPAVPPLEIGGDWYDVLSIGDHRIGIVVGDCVGRGLPAAAIMGQLRSSARALLINGAGPAAVLEQLDLAASLIPNAYCTTVFSPFWIPNPACWSTAMPVICPRCSPDRRARRCSPMPGRCHSRSFETNLARKYPGGCRPARR